MAPGQTLSYAKIAKQPNEKPQRAATQMIVTQTKTAGTAPTSKATKRKALNKCREAKASTRFIVDVPTNMTWRGNRLRNTTKSGTGFNTGRGREPNSLLQIGPRDKGASHWVIETPPCVLKKLENRQVFLGMTRKEIPTCKYCAGSHDSRKCGDRTNLKCANCRLAHQASSSECKMREQNNLNRLRIAIHQLADACGKNGTDIVFLQELVISYRKVVGFETYRQMHTDVNGHSKLWHSPASNERGRMVEDLVMNTCSAQSIKQGR
ncbi:CCHC-type domain-containing protein [Aphis craccivora]|uniref:CCHC-type domain-containing protein n=1 Tax=Aphis craccivora TaxID=307492 RepID=A0A6G0VXV8_APHCR|nr:CCHC-type domain-containing protein [Aphis craccivora]